VPINQPINIRTVRYEKTGKDAWGSRPSPSVPKLRSDAIFNHHTVREAGVANKDPLAAGVGDLQRAGFPDIKALAEIR